jgi:hypothetical protein
MSRGAHNVTSPHDPLRLGDQQLPRWHPQVAFAYNALTFVPVEDAKKPSVGIGDNDRPYIPLLHPGDERGEILVGADRRRPFLHNPTYRPFSLSVECITADSTQHELPEPENDAVVLMCPFRLAPSVADRRVKGARRYVTVHGVDRPQWRLQRALHG